MASLPANLALANVADGAAIVASDHRNNYSAIQTETNALLALLAAGTTGQVFIGNGTTVGFAYPPGYRFAYTEFTASVTANTVAEASASSVVAASAVTFDGATQVEIEFFCPALILGGATNQIGINLWDGATDLGRLFDGTVVSTPAGNLPGGSFKRTITPSAAAHTYSVRTWSVAATNFIAAAGAGGVGTKLPGYIKITKA